jgi:ATP-dependent protease ClpP protease subunit
MYMTAQQAADYGLIDSVLNPPEKVDGKDDKK